MEQQPEQPVRIYNTDRTDVNMEAFCEKAQQPPKKGSCLGKLILLLLVLTGIFLYLAWGGKLPWQ